MLTSLGRGLPSAAGRAAASLLLLLSVPASARDLPGPPGSPRSQAEGIFVLDGSFVHNVGELHMNITNWGLIGSQPPDRRPWSDAPSAQWPGGSGVEYLYAAGLWVGAVRDGIALVSTGQFQVELLPSDDVLDTIYRSHRGAAGGDRYPQGDGDDDGDGRADEDPLNGLDDDGDGAIDEDFAAVGDQYFRLTLRDDLPLGRELNPDHEPLHIAVVQESFQWENDLVNDFVGFTLTITNTGRSDLEEVYLGIFADGDVGPRGRAEMSSDDMPGFYRGAVRAPDGSRIPLSLGCVYDCDGDDGLSPGWFGVAFLDHPTDPAGEKAPRAVGITGFQQFSGTLPFDRGGDPTNDAERYELLSRAEIDPCPEDCEKADDYRILLSTGPFSRLEPGASLRIHVAMVVGAGLEGLKRNAAAAAQVYYGAWFDRDHDPTTGILGRERRVCLSDFGPDDSTNPLYSLSWDCHPEGGLFVPITRDALDAEGCTWINGDCGLELARRGAWDCPQVGWSIPEEESAGCTGVLGKETWVPWLVGTAPAPPDLRVWAAHRRVHLFWNDRSELDRDLLNRRLDFESYRIWRADGWDRPYGSSVENGPEKELWRLLAEFDRVDSMEVRRSLAASAEATERMPLGANTGLESIRYVPRVLRRGSWESGYYRGLALLVEQILMERPQAVDRTRTIRYDDAEGRRTALGEAYPQLAAWTSPEDEAQGDTLLWSRLDPPMRFYEYVDREVHDGIHYFHAVTATDFDLDPGRAETVPTGPGIVGDPQSNFVFTIPPSEAQSREDRRDFGEDVYVVPNPATRATLAELSRLHPSSDDPTGVRVEFRNLPRARNVIRIFTLAGDLVQTIGHDGRAGAGTAAWNLVSRNGQQVVSGIYLYSVESEDRAFATVVHRLTLIW